MITLLIGHRGVGKSTLLERIKAYGQELGVSEACFDLDAEIERRTGLRISEIFRSSGESEFRRLEVKILNELVQETRDLGEAEKRIWIALGAGFSGPIPFEVRVLWVRRQTDAKGRIFLDRPRLSEDQPPLKEYAERYAERENRFRTWCDDQIVLSEGFLEPNVAEAALLGFREIHVGGVVTLRPELLRSELKMTSYLEARRRLHPLAFEVRQDWFTAFELEMLAMMVEPDEMLFAHRRDRSLPESWRGGKQDWALELGAVPKFDPFILSLHERESELNECFKKFPKTFGGICKLAVEIETFGDLLLGHQWWLEDPEHRSFLPRSKSGRWSWYRQLFGRRMPLAFWRDDVSPYLDQPCLSDWLRIPSDWQDFVAVLGDPVDQSWTPAEHFKFCTVQSQAVVAIPIRENEWSRETVQVLRNLGLRAAAVTSPLKIKTVELCDQLTAEARRLQSVNTIVSAQDSVGEQGKVRTDGASGLLIGHNTDLAGLRELLKPHVPNLDGAVIWGGGGTEPVIRELLPHAPLFSVREKRDRRTGVHAREVAPRLVVWAVGRARFENDQFPPDNWQPIFVVDLNYSEDSPGREYALRVGARYFSGLPMFRHQAERQREFWQRI